MVMNLFSYARVCPNATQKDPIGRIDGPFTISSSQFNSIKDPWNATGLDKDGRHFYSWNLKGTSLSNCGYFYVYGNAKVDPGFNLTRSVTPSTLKKTHTLVTVTTKVEVRSSVGQLCINEYDYGSSYAYGNLSSFSVSGSRPLVTSIKSGTIGRVNEGFSACANGGAPGEVITASAVWNVTKLTSSNLIWKPTVYASNNVCCFPGAETTSTVSFDLKANNIPHFTWKVGFGGAASVAWLYSPYAYDYLYLQLNPVATPVP